MNIKHLPCILGALVSAIPAVANAEAPAMACVPQPLDLARGVSVIRALRAFTGADGASHVVETELKGATATFMGGSVKLTQFDLGSPSFELGSPTKVALVYGFPNIDIPPHPAPGREIFIVLSGSSELRLLSGTVYPLKPGTIFIAEDMGSTGRGGRAGPCGYVALDVQFGTPPPTKP